MCRLRLPRVHRARTLRKRLLHTLLTRLALGLTVAALCTFFAVHTVMQDRLDTQLNGTAQLFNKYAAQQPLGKSLDLNASKDAQSSWRLMTDTGLLPIFIEVRDPHNRIVFKAARGDEPALPAQLKLGPPHSGPQHDGATLFSADSGSSVHPGYAFRLRASQLPGGRGYLILGVSQQDLNTTMSSVGWIEFVALLLAFGMVGVMANRRIKRNLEPFERMGDQIVAIGAGELDRRVDPSDVVTEVGRVGASVNAMLARLERAFQEQRSSEERLRRFIADASHELRTPLASIRGYAELFRRGAASRPEDLALAMRRIESESARMGVLVDELLLLARLDSGRPLGRGMVDLGALARDAARDSQAAGPQWPVEVTVRAEQQEQDEPHGVGVDAAAQRVEVCGDADRLRQLLANLLSNVRAHTPPGTPASVSVRRVGQDAVIEVADTGPGLTPEQQARVFERFYRADASRKRGDAAGGSGLGLSIVASVAAAHGGRAEVRSAAGGGAVFTVTLPVEGSLAGADENIAKNDVPALTGLSQQGHSATPGGPGSLSDEAPRTEPARDHGSRRGSGAMDRLSSFVTAHRKWIYGLWLVAFVAGIAASSTLSNHLDKTFSMPGQPSYTANQAIAAEYGNGGMGAPLVAVAQLPAGVPADGSRVSAAFGALADIPQTRIADYANTGDAKFIGSDRRTTFALVFTPGVGGMATGKVQDQISAAVQQRLTAALPAGSTVRITGEQQLQNAGSGSGKGLSILNEIMIGGIGALAVLLFVFASLLALVPLLVAAVSVLTAFLGILAVTEITSVSMIVQFLVGLIGLGVAIDYSLLLVTRWREELAHGYDNDTAVHRAMSTAGRAVAFSGVTVALGLLALVVLPVPFLRSIGFGGMIIPLVSVCVTLTLVPALLSGIGKRLDWPRIRHEDKASRSWTAWANLVVRRRWIAALGALAVLGVLAFNTTGLKIGDPSSDSLAQSGPAHEGVLMLRQAGIPTGVLTPLELYVPKSASTATVASTAASVSGIDFTATPSGAAWTRPDSSLVLAVPTAESTSTAGENTTRALRGALAAVPGTMTGGLGAVEVDLIHAVYGTFPLMLALLGLLTFVLLARAFRSIVLPLKAVALNLLSLAAVYGVLVLVWQKGHGSNAIWGIPATGAITGWIPLMVFAFLYGLSMDYEVFILARMREEYDATGSTRRAVVTGIGRTGRLVTSAALILFLAMAALGSAPSTDVKIFATALGAGILLDATVVRALLVPALISLFGRWNWWMPVWAARILRIEPCPARRETDDDDAAAGSGAGAAAQEAAESAPRAPEREGTRVG
ncbi:MMPL family transporter [Actinocrinis puniceicyclus]|uniref:histidine kinase n=1 Tax=Actinocrinis puniceicyclus TaxID=977794 RepID=A0A8J8BFM8_9ACTN|nr:MMPL family transporter [Actinocrinis puniceicyclus]MBS2964899.1 MMPL family transporter [Actinocrinis puniceicyclus]